MIKSSEAVEVRSGTRAASGRGRARRRVNAFVIALVVLAVGASTSCSQGGLIEFTVNSNKDVTGFSFAAASNGGVLQNDVAATINGTNIMATVPFGTNVTALVATFTTDSASVTVGGVTQISGVTRDDFTAPVAYLVTAADATTKTFLVTVVVAPASAKDLTAYGFLAANNVGALGSDITAMITGGTITATAAFGTDVTALAATFSTDGVSVTVGGVPQVSGVTRNDFTHPVTYVVTAADHTTSTYVVTVLVAASFEKDITSFSFLAIKNSGVLSADVTATISGLTIMATVPFGTKLSGLVATFVTTGVNVNVGGMVQVSGTTANDFTLPIVYMVTAADGSTQSYAVIITVAADSAKSITSFAFPAADNVGVLAADVPATIDEAALTIDATVPFGTDVTGLVASFTAPDDATVTVAGNLQVTDLPPGNNFTDPVMYKVTAADGTSQVYQVTVGSGPGMDSFGFPSLGVTGTIDNSLHAIAVVVPFGTDLDGLVAGFTTNGAAVSIGGVPQTSGMGSNDFSSPVDYTLTAADSTTVDYTVTVTFGPGMVSFGFPALSVTGTIDNTLHTIAVTVPFGTNVTTLVAGFVTNGASVSIGGTPQTSGVGSNDFSSPVDYTLTAADGSTVDYNVTVSFGPGMVSFGFPALSVTGTIDNTLHTIAVTVPFGTNVTTLVAGFVTNGASVSIGGVPQTSGMASNDFSSPVDYTLTAADSTTVDYTVTVSFGPGMVSFGFPALSVTGTIDNTLHTIAVTVPFGTVVTGLTAAFVTNGASVSIGGVPQTSGMGSNDFSSPVDYTLTAGTLTVDYIVNVSFGPAMLTFGFPSLSVTGSIDTSGHTIAVTVPFGTDVTELTAAFTTNGASVSIGGIPQTSGTGSNNFSSPVDYTLTADGSTVDYLVTVTATGCGDGTIEAGEQCDLGAGSDGSNGACPFCQNPVCGDGYLETGVEQCDDGPANGIGDPCSEICTLGFCGDGIAQGGSPVTSIDFQWLVTSCDVPQPTTFSIDGVVVESAVGDANCTCDPPGGFQTVTVTDPAVLALVLNGPNTFAVSYSEYIAWALVTVHTAVATPIVVYEANPGEAAAMSSDLCVGGPSGGYVYGLTNTITASVGVFEQCDDGNTDDSDACHNNCTNNP